MVRNGSLSGPASRCNVEIAQILVEVLVKTVKEESHELL
jgi:hypothetical protein